MRSVYFSIFLMLLYIGSFNLYDFCIHIVNCWRLWCKHNVYVSRNIRLTTGLWGCYLFLGLILCAVEIVWNFSLCGDTHMAAMLRTLNFINEKMCSHWRGQVSNILWRLLHVLLSFAHVIILTILFCRVNIILLLDELTRKLLHICYSVKIGFFWWEGGQSQFYRWETSNQLYDMLPVICTSFHPYHFSNYIVMKRYCRERLILHCIIFVLSRFMANLYGVKVYWCEMELCLTLNRNNLVFH